MQTKDWWYLIATVVSPFLAAGITAWLTLKWQNRKERRDSKMRVFETLMAARGNILDFQTAREWTHALNLIDVVFSDAPNVLIKWHELYPMLQHQDVQPGQAHKQIEMLHEMAKSVGIDNLQQTDIDEPHFPGAISNPLAKANEVQDQLLRVLKKTESVTVQPRPAAIMPPPGQVPPARR